MLRLVAQQACHRPRAGERPPDHPLRRAGRGLELVLHRRDLVHDPRPAGCRNVNQPLPPLPPLPLEQWEPTKQTLHLWAQIVGKIRMASTAPRNHWWHVPLYVDVRGLTTRRMHARNDVSFQIDFDFIDHALVVKTDQGQTRSLPLIDGLSVAQFDSSLHALLAELD